MGAPLGDIIAEGEDIYGEGVNITARLEALSQPGCITLSDDAFRQVRDRVNVEFHDLGEPRSQKHSAPSEGLGVALPNRGSAPLSKHQAPGAGYVNRGKISSFVVRAHT
jgi:adenylate cyclase